MWMGWAEIVLGVLGLIAAATGRSHRSTGVIALGLGLMGVSRLLPSGRWHGSLLDLGGVLILFGLGMMLSVWRRQRRQ
ncbi:hypothetical protein TPY_2820 [Sulfobacillus acidophilus TPY]|uniref:Uncharacterized protein n=1 Tax=Sulfobacillus acidophilus (strain ATCC 700253 / DSM 10332 / NAL) TaxID=679936 RepID=G8TTX2_SULAD|nr:hypothetical protein TPY_2820 [Sulfobacillus acidophilus TPY]AEW04563.1 hypothetical protein Sulac_1063 [Sulfobacillus acidophilus DSM 10332]